MTDFGPQKEPASISRLRAQQRSLAKAQAIIDALPPEQRDLVWRNGMASNNEPRTPVSRDENGETVHE